ncbi:MAG: HAMP domain-containing histidine kinase [Thaumarchaeota archaeon]|nr:MAG: HAMP domain-containing histidine kinase [Nitrososphaerota archaeon]
MIVQIQKTGEKKEVFYGSKSVPNTSEMHKQLELHNKIQEFINIANHEMKTPVQAILTYSELLQNGPERNRFVYIEAILRNARRLQKLSDNLLDITRIYGQTTGLKKEKFDLNALISYVIEDYRNPIENVDYGIKNIGIEFKPVCKIFVNADRDRLEQVISNLLDNALKFTQEGKISILVEKKEDNKAVVTISDTGRGWMLEFFLDYLQNLLRCQTVERD